MKINREKQLELLKFLADHDMKFVDVQRLEPREEVSANLTYLEGHGLVENKYLRTLGESDTVFGSQITSRGIDFLLDDGGLSSVLGVVTVKLHADTVRDLIDAKLQESDLPETEKKRLSDHLRELPAEGLKHLTTRLVDLALDNLPAALLLLRAQTGF